MNSAISTYLKLAGYSSTISQGWLKSTPVGSNSDDVTSSNKIESSPQTVSITAMKSVRGIDEDRTRTYLEHYIVPDNQKDIIKLHSFGLDVVKPVKYDISPSGNHTIHLHNQFHGVTGKEDKIIIEVIDNIHSKNYRIDVSNVHGNFIGDAWFSGISWSFDETLVAYVAAIKQEKPQTYFSNPNKQQQSSSSYKFEYKEDWGETFSGIGELGIFVLNIKTMQVFKVNNIDNELFTVGQPCFVTPNNIDTSINQQPAVTVVSPLYLLAYTAWKNTPRKLGLLHCFQRPTCLFATDLTSLVRNESDLLSNPTIAASNTDVIDSKTISPVASASSSATDSLGGMLRHVLLTTGLSTARSPQCYHAPAFASHCNENLLIFLGHEKGFDVHNGCSELFSIAVDDIILHTVCKETNNEKEPILWKKMVPEIWNPESHGGSTTDINDQDVDYTFPGIYTARLCNHCFSVSERGEAVVVLASQWGSVSEIITVSLLTGVVDRILESNLENSNLSTHRGSCTVLDVKGSLILYEYSSPSFPPRLAIIDLYTREKKFMQTTSTHAIQIMKISATGQPEGGGGGVQDLLTDTIDHQLSIDSSGNIHGIGWKVVQYSEDGIPFESILLYPKPSTTTLLNDEHIESIPLLVVPHGGPHSVVPTSYISSYAYLCIELNTAVLHVNYRGSPGFGQASILSLPGKIGRNDVDDVMKALNHALDLDASNVLEVKSLKKKFINPDKVAIVGGSHGGFLTGHCIGQYPDVFKAAAMRNPVTNIPSMVAVSDIADWCFIEALNQYNFNTVQSPSCDDLVRMHQCSPIRYIHQVKTPTLLCLGGKDRRVPSSQGLEYYHVLKSRGEVPTKLLIFPEDNHPIDKPASEADHWLSISNWIATYMK